MRCLSTKFIVLVAVNLLIISTLYGCHCEDQNLEETGNRGSVEHPELEDVEDFIATNEWQEVKPGEFFHIFFVRICLVCPKT